jgi:hypothetical protein
MVTDVLVLLSPILKFGGAAPSSVIVPVTLAPTLTSAELNVTDLSLVPVTVSVALSSLLMRLAAMVASPDPVASAVNVAVWSPPSGPPLRPVS